MFQPFWSLLQSAKNRAHPSDARHWNDEGAAALAKQLPSRKLR